LENFNRAKGHSDTTVKNCDSAVGQCDTTVFHCDTTMGQSDTTVSTVIQQWSTVTPQLAMWHKSRAL